MTSDFTVHMDEYLPLRDKGSKNFPVPFSKRFSEL